MPAAAGKIVNERLAAKNQPVMPPTPPLPVMLSAFEIAVLVSTVVYRGWATFTNDKRAWSYTKLAPQDSMVIELLPV